MFFSPTVRIFTWKIFLIVREKVEADDVQAMTPKSEEGKHASHPQMLEKERCAIRSIVQSSGELACGSFQL